MNYAKKEDEKMSNNEFIINDISNRDQWNNAFVCYREKCKEYNENEVINFDFCIRALNTDDLLYCIDKRTGETGNNCFDKFFTIIFRSDAQNEKIHPRFFIKIEKMTDEEMNYLYDQIKESYDTHSNLKSSSIIINSFLGEGLKNMENPNRKKWMDIWRETLKKTDYTYGNLKIIDNRLSKTRLNISIDDSFEINELRYYFPLKLTNNYMCLNLDVKERSDEFRIRQMLSCIDCANYAITLNNQSIPRTYNSASDLFPIVEVIKNTSPNDKIFEKLSANLKKHLFDLYKGDDCDKYFYSDIDFFMSLYGFLFKESLDKDKEIINTFGDIKKKIDVEKKEIKRLNKDIIGKNKIIKTLKEDTYGNKENIFILENEVNILKNKVENGNKKIKKLKIHIFKLINQILENDNDARVDGFSDDFSSLIYLFLIRNLIVNERIFGNDEKKKRIDKALLEKNKINAKSYAEGLWQIIENSFVHSNGQTAFFGMRIYKTDTNKPMSENKKEVMERESLWNNYWKDHSKDPQNNIFNKTENGQRVYTDFLEFYVIDDALNEEYEAEGIIDKIKTDQKTLSENAKNKLNALSKIFELSEDDYFRSFDKKESEPVYYTKHYGMHWLKRHIDKLSGIFEIRSPVKELPDFDKCCYSNCFESKVFEENKFENLTKEDLNDLFFTEYSILIPLNYGKEDAIKNDSASKTMTGPLTYDVGEDFFNKGFYFSKSPAYYKYILEEGINKPQEIQSIFNLLNGYCGEVVNENERLYSFKKSDKYNLIICREEECSADNIHIEILAKAVFNYIYNYNKEKQDDRILISIEFVHQNSINEFVRLFAIFYEKLKISNKEYMKNVQIAFCLRGKKKNVSFVLAGKNFETTYQTANNFVYYNADASVDFVPLLSFLSEYETQNKIDKIKIFPFDLFLEN